MDFKENIMNYSESIDSIDNFRDAARQNPGHLIGGLGNTAHINCIREIFQNGVDEMVKRSSPCDYVKLVYDERNLSATVYDNGRGIPFDKMIQVFTSEYTSSNYRKSDYEYSSGTHGLGAKISAALSSFFSVKSHILGEAKYFELHDGHVWDKGIIEVDPEINQGTIITFIPYEGLGQITTTCDDVVDLVSRVILLTQPGSQIEYIGIDKNGNVKYNQVFKNINGIADKLDSIPLGKLVNNIQVCVDTGKEKADVVLNFSTDVNSEGFIASYANMTPTKGGYHEDGFVNGVTKFFRNYMNKIYLAKNNKVTVNANDIKSVMMSVIHVSVLKPIWQSQSKDYLANEEMLEFMSRLMEDSLAEWAKNNPKDLMKIAKLLKEVAEIRLKSEDSKIKLSNQYKKSAVTGLPAEYKKPSGKKNLELLIVEGKSALSSTMNARDHRYQALYPIRGKLLNALDNTQSRMLANEEVAAIIQIVGGGYGKNFNLNNVKFDKVIFLTDPDPDGNHISALLLNLFAIYMRPMIEDGRVYKAVPPLYGVKSGNKMKYFTNKAEQVKYVQNLFANGNQVSINKENLTNSKLFELLYKNSEYVSELEILSSNHKVPPIIMESILIGKINNIPIKKTFKHLKDKYFRFLELNSFNGYDVITGLAGNEFIEVILTENLFEGSQSVIDILNSNEYYYYELNDNKVSLYELMRTYKDYEPTSLQRYKGLGEMEAYQLCDSTLNPDNRTLIQYTNEDIMSNIDEMRRLTDNKSDLIKDIKLKRSELLS